ncbi:DUF134 domain-containing protein [Candidatus Bipolaricaulota bacterium]|nr:DUF134 domain-containing protein [Candidatus Bipolaricaulota bacterium]
MDRESEKLGAGRPKKPRYCQSFRGPALFKPAGVPMTDLEIVPLGIDELEALRLCDVEGFHQQQAADAMGISRGTVQRLAESGRKKLVEAVLLGKAVTVETEDHVIFPDRSGGRHRRHGRVGPSPGWHGR